MKPWILYTLLRLGIFVVLLVVLIPVFGGLPSPTGQIVATIVAAIISLCVSYLVLGRQRHAVAASIAESREAKRTPSADEAAEDAVIDGAEADAASEGDGRA